MTFRAEELRIQKYSLTTILKCFGKSMRSDRREISGKKASHVIYVYI